MSSPTPEQLGEIAQYETRNAEQLRPGQMIADARRPLRGKPTDELDRDKRESDELLKDISSRPPLPSPTFRSGLTRP